jgi:hypothetical protein
MTDNTCIGFGARDGACGKPSDTVLNPSGLWCRECELDRRAAITAQMLEIRRALEER